MLTRFGSFLYRARWYVFVTALALLLAAGVFGVGVFSSLHSSSYGDPGSDSTQAEQLLDTRLGGSAPDVIILLRSGTLHASDPAFTQAATTLLNSLQSRPQVVSLNSYYSTHNQSFISRDGHETFATLRLSSQSLPDKIAQYTALKPLFVSSTLQVTTGGSVPINQAINNQTNADLARAETITFPILAILLLFVFGGVIAAGIPLLIGGAAILFALAALRLITLFTDVSTYATNVVTMLGLGLSIDYALFIITRFREELGHDENDVRGALQRTMRTAGRTIIFSALTVSTALLSLMLFPLPFLRSIGLGAIAAILAVMLTSLTLLPAVLALLGKRINSLSFNRFLRRRRSTQTGEQQGAWYRLATAVMRWPIPVALAVLAILFVLGWPFLHISFATPDITILPAGQETRVVNEQLSQNFTQQGKAQLVIVVTTPGDALAAQNLASLDSYIKSIQGVSGVLSVDSLVTVSPTLTLSEYQQLYAHPNASPQLAQVAAQLAQGNLSKVVVALQPAERSAATINIVNQIRAIHTQGGLTALVDGATPIQMDLLTSLGRTLPYAFLVIIVSVFILLFLMTGSLIIPIKAILLNVLSLTATFGGLVWIFQDGHLQSLLNFTTTGNIDATQPVLIFAIAFGLSMDYEVFLLSRIKERFDQTGDNRLAVSSGIQRTGWLITSAALLLAIVLGAFGTSKIILVQEIGIGLAIAVIIDATLIRMLLVPATMRLLGNLNWWAPAPLRWLWQRIGLSETESTAEHHQPEIPALVAPEPSTART